MFNFLVGPISNLVGNAVKGFVETKKAKAELALTEIKAQKSLKEAQIAGKISWEASAVDQMKGSWKDELILICLLVPAVAVFIPGWTPHIKQVLKLYTHSQITTSTSYTSPVRQVLASREQKVLWD